MLVLMNTLGFMTTSFLLRMSMDCTSRSKSLLKLVRSWLAFSSGISTRRVSGFTTSTAMMNILLDSYVRSIPAYLLYNESSIRYSPGVSFRFDLYKICR